jgi:D-serine deaminase-like pyridoxal phosphate-dependent protein
VSRAIESARALVGRPWQELDTPALLVDLDRLEANIRQMAAVARDNGLALRPHFKTHKSVAIARRQIVAGAIGMTVAKLDEAEVLVDAGVGDILLANQIVAEPKLGRAMALAARARLTLAVDSREGAAALSGAATAVGLRIPVAIEIDSGLRRCGVLPGDAVGLARAIADLPGIALEGVFTHAGHAYGARDREQLAQFAVGEAGAVVEAASALRGLGIPVRTVSVGSTPTAELVAGRPGITELRPGTYVFYDAMQVALGSAHADAVALTVAATVVSRPAPERAVIDAGAKTLGLDKGVHSSELIVGHGRLAEGDGVLERISEEHGMLRIPADSPLAPGDRVRVVPNHACSVGNLGRFFVGLRDGVVAEVITIDAAGGVH